MLLIFCKFVLMIFNGPTLTILYMFVDSDEELMSS